MGLKTLLIAGGSASGKSWLAARICESLPDAMVLSQDRFYHDRPSGCAADRHDFDFDQPYAIDWAELCDAVRSLSTERSTDVPIYDFAQSLRAGSEPLSMSGDTLIVDGTLVLSQPEVAALADASIYVSCPEPLRRARREQRDVVDRKRHIDSVRQQLAEQVFPAHEKFVRPSAARADLVLDARDILADPDAAVTQVLALLGKSG